MVLLMLRKHPKGGKRAGDQGPNTASDLEVVNRIKLVLIGKVMVNAQRGKITGKQTTKSLDEVSQSSVRGVERSSRTRVGIVAIENVECDGIQKSRGNAVEA